MPETVVPGPATSPNRQGEYCCEENAPGPHCRTSQNCARWSGCGNRFLALGIAQHVAAAPHRLDVVVAIGCGGQLLSQLADEHVDDLQLRLIHAAVKVIE